MNVLQIGILVFTVIEILNVMLLYFKPESRIGNGAGVFNHYHQAMEDDKYKEFVTYLINWVAGTKLIFILLSIVIVIFGNYLTQLHTAVVMIISILSFYYRLYPIIKKLDHEGHITPKGYYKTLGLMINTMIIGFIVILIISVL